MAFVLYEFVFSVSASMNIDIWGIAASVSFACTFSSLQETAELGSLDSVPFA
jgi:hypothetical protein